MWYPGSQDVKVGFLKWLNWKSFGQDINNDVYSNYNFCWVFGFFRGANWATMSNWKRNHLRQLSTEQRNWVCDRGMAPVTKTPQSFGHRGEFGRECNGANLPSSFSGDAEWNCCATLLPVADGGRLVKWQAFKPTKVVREMGLSENGGILLISHLQRNPFSSTIVQFRWPAFPSKILSHFHILRQHRQLYRWYSHDIPILHKGAYAPAARMSGNMKDPRRESGRTGPCRRIRCKQVTWTDCHNKVRAPEKRNREMLKLTPSSLFWWILGLIRY